MAKSWIWETLFTIKYLFRVAFRRLKNDFKKLKANFIIAGPKWLTHGFEKFYLLLSACLGLLLGGLKMNLKN